LQENATLLTIPARSPIWVGKAGLLCTATVRDAPVCFLRGGGRVPASARFFLAVDSAVPGRLPAHGSRLPFFACFVFEVGSPGFCLGDFAPSLECVAVFVGGLPLRGGVATAVSGGA